MAAGGAGRGRRRAAEVERQLMRTQVVKALEARVTQERSRLGRPQSAEYRFAQRRDARPEGLHIGAARTLERIHGFAVVKYDLRPGAGEGAEGRCDRLAGEIGNDAEPQKEGRSIRVEAGLGELVEKALPLEIDGREAEGLGREAGLADPGALPFLRLGMVDFENAKPRLAMGIAQAESVESGAEDNGLPQAARYRLGEPFFGVATPGRDEEAHEAPIRVLVRLLDDGFGVLAQNGDGERVTEDRSALQQLMDRAMGRSALSGEACLSSHRSGLSRVKAKSKRRAFAPCGQAPSGAAPWRPSAHESKCSFFRNLVRQPPKIEGFNRVVGIGNSPRRDFCVRISYCGSDREDRPEFPEPAQSFDRAQRPRVGLFRVLGYPKFRGAQDGLVASPSLCNHDERNKFELGAFCGKVPVMLAGRHFYAQVEDVRQIGPKSPWLFRGMICAAIILMSLWFQFLAPGGVFH